MVRACLLLLALTAAGCGHRRVLADLEPVIASDEPSRPDGQAVALALRALVAENDGDPDRAERAWRWLLRLEPDDARAWAGYGGFLERRQRGEDAFAAYMQALDLSPRDASAHLGLARLYLALGDDASAASHLDVAAASGDPDALHLFARLLLRNGDRRGAWGVYDVWSAQRPTRQLECLDRARVAIALERHDDAVDDLLCALDDEGAGPDVGESFVKAARASCRVGTAWRWAVEHRLAERDAPEWRAVAVAVGRAVGDPDLIAAALGPDEGFESALLADRVEILNRAERSQDALALLEEASVRNPADVTPRLWRAEILGGLGRTEEALALLDGVPVDDRLHGAAERLRAEILLASGEPEAAIEVLGAVPEPPWGAVVTTARALVAVDRADDAEVVLLGAGHVGEAERWRQIALLRAERGDRSGAMEAFDAAGGDARALFDRAALVERLGAPEGAAEAWRRAAEADPRRVAAWLGVARTSDDPLPALRRAVDADPCDPEARRLLAEEEPPCEAVASLDAAWDAAPRDPAVLGALAAAYPACAEVRRAEGEPLVGVLEGLGKVEWTWRVLAREDEADRTAAVRRALEGA